MPTRNDTDLLNTFHSISTTHSIPPPTLFWCKTLYYTYYKVLLRTTKYFWVLQTTNSVLLGTSKYYSGITPYYKVLLRTTKYYSGIIPFYKVPQRLTKYCKVLPCTGPFDGRNTWIVWHIAQSDLSDAKHNGTTTFMLDSRSNTCNNMYVERSNQNHLPTSPNIAPATKNNIPREVWQTAEPSFTSGGATRVTLQHHQPATKNDIPKYQMSIWQTAELSCTSCRASRITFNITKHCACHERGHSTISEKIFTNGWTIIYIAQSNPRHLPTSPYIAPPLKNDDPRYQRKIWQRAEPSFTSRGATRVTLQHHQILGLPRNRRFQDMTEIFEIAETSCTMWARSENDPTMNPSVRNPQYDWGYFSRSPRAFCLEKYNMWRSGYHSKFHQILLTKYHPCHENWMCNLNATSSNVAPATKIECATWLQL